MSGLSSMNFGFALCSIGTANVALQWILHYGDTDDQRDNEKTLVSTLAVVGIALGSIFASSIVKFGKRKIIIISLIVSLITSSLSIIENLPLVIITRAG